MEFLQSRVRPDRAAHKLLAVRVQHAKTKPAGMRTTMGSALVPNVETASRIRVKNAMMEKKTEKKLRDVRNTAIKRTCVLRRRRKRMREKIPTALIFKRTYSERSALLTKEV